MRPRRDAYSLRLLLSQYTGEAPQSMRFTRGPYGKPLLDGHSNLSFNVSHSGTRALIAISTRRIVGIDIEQVNFMLDWRPLADLVCTDGERLAIAHLPEIQKVAMFFRYWTAKEALLKALGLGITQGLQVIAVNPFANGVQRPTAQCEAIAEDVSVLRCNWLDEIIGYVSCLAYGKQ